MLEGIYKQERNQLFTRVDSDRTKGNGFKIKGEVLAQAAQRCGCPIPGGV